MKKLLIVGIVLAACFVGTASDTKNLAIKIPCTHEKIKAFDGSGWALCIEYKDVPNQYYSRMYKCKECKVTILIQQAIVIPKIKCEKTHLDSNFWRLGGSTDITY